MIAPMAYVDDAEGWRRLIASLAQLSNVLEGGSEGMHTIDRDGLVATVTPAAPERSIVNDVVYWDADALADAYDDLDAAYRAADIAAWTVWVPDTDTTTAELLAGRGHLLDSDPEAMVIDLDGVERPPEPQGFTRDGDPQVMTRLNDAVYGMAELGMFVAAFDLLERRDDMHVYMAGDGEPQACVMAYDHEDDCSIWFVATLEQARGKGYAGALMGHALADGRERGRTTSTLQATDMGRPVYERLGYRSLGEIQLWEKRRPAA
jgi:GNAT superfamily N-acetyltransferase